MSTQMTMTLLSALTGAILFVMYRGQLRLGYRRWLFYQQAIKCGLSEAQRKMLWQLAQTYQPRDSQKLLMNSRILNKVLLRAITDVELDLSIDLKERELRQYQYYELKRFFDRVDIIPSLQSTKELKGGLQLLFNRPENVRATFVGWSAGSTTQGFLINLDKASVDTWNATAQSGEFEFIYCDEYKKEHHFLSHLRSARAEGSTLVLLFQHTKSIDLVVNSKPPSRRFNREALVALADLNVDRSDNRQFSPQKEKSCWLLEVSLASAVIKVADTMNANQFVYLQFMGVSQRIVCYGRVERVVALEQHWQVHVQFLQTSRSSLNQISSLVYDL
jgi:hypothetical protein